MPRRPRGACTYPGCGGRVVSEGRCAQHQRPPAPDRRPSAAQRGYDVKWRRIRAAFLKRYPACVGCGAQATQVDHIVPLARGGTNQWANLQPLCASCHSQKTNQADGGGWRNR